MIVLDASAAVDWLLQTAAGRAQDHRAVQALKIETLAPGFQAFREFSRCGFPPGGTKGE
jgi:predicted nucleic acid-binding protein